MVLPRCKVCDEVIQRGKEKFVPRAMAGPNRVTMFVHANPRECKPEKMPRTNKHECPRQGCASKRVHFMARGVDTGHGNYAATNPTAEIWACDACRRQFC